MGLTVKVVAVEEKSILSYASSCDLSPPPRSQPGLFVSSTLVVGCLMFCLSPLCDPLGPSPSPPPMPQQRSPPRTLALVLGVGLGVGL